ncbi:MAG: PVC-type heme-binding CxxCH protein [Planctomycetota bacterium]|nr:PVC-type heme-binding CxxCH protein [Planctomycetota bacterium]
MNLPTLLIMTALLNGSSASGVRVADGIVVETWASDPMLVDPVAFCIDEQGRVYVAETARQERGVEDTRTQPYWNLDDISLQTVEDRLAMYEKWAHRRSDGMNHYTAYEDRIRRLVDTDGDGRADLQTVFSGGYNDPLDGTGSGVLVHRGDVYYTNIPHLWRLRDRDDDGVADEQEALLSGFGVRIALRGHDMHGLTWGPDGRLYWSIGDRGYNVVNREGVRISDPTSGAVFRCEPDGSNLEVFHTGLRNPQEIAFDDFGALFTGDNNSDAGDEARLVHVAEGGQTGWRMEYQTLEGVNVRGPWVQEGIWKTAHEHRPAWVLAPVAHVGNGPSGLVHYPGLGLDARYDDHFFMCNFSGSPEHSQVKSFAVEPDGAGYRVVDVHDFASNVLCTDVDFGYDGRMYVSDWVEGWYQAENGRILTIHDPRHVDDPRIAEVTTLFSGGFDSLTDDRLTELLEHDDQRVRLRAQFELASRGSESIASFARMTGSGSPQLARLHAIWGLGMIARGADDPEPSVRPLLPLLLDDDREVRAQAAKVLGESGWSQCAPDLVELIFDPEPRVVYHAVMAVGRLGHVEGIDAITEMLWSNDDRDLHLRHAGVMALSWLDDREALLALSRDEFPAVRLAVLLALRRSGDPAVSSFLQDSDPFIAAEAARAINDLPIEAATPALADQLERFSSTASGTSMQDAPAEDRTALLRRALYAGQRIGRGRDAAAVADVALLESNPIGMRREAMAILSDWREPSVRDRVNGAHRPVVGERDVDGWRTVLARALPRLVQSDDVELATSARSLAGEESIALDDSITWSILEDPGADPRERVACLAQLHSSSGEGDRAIRSALDADEPVLRGAALRLLADDRPQAAVEAIADDLRRDGIPRRQHAISVLGTIDSPQARTMLKDLFGQTRTGELPTALHVDVIDAFDGQEGETPDMMRSLAFGDDPLARYRSAWVGGDADRGRELVLYHSGAACIRCHVVEGRGGAAGPDLRDVAGRLDRKALLESVIAPSAVIADGYGDASAMPEMIHLLDPRDVRDIVEYLSTRR